MQGLRTAAWSAAAFVLPIDEESQQAAAATAGLEEYARAGAATDSAGREGFCGGECVACCMPNSDVLGNVSGLHAWCPAATDLHAAPNSDGMETVFGLHGASGVAATELPAATIMDGLGAFPDLHGETNLSGVFRLHDFGGHGGAASVWGDTGSIAFSNCGDVVIRDSPR